MSKPEILFHHHYHAGVITLNRPEALNAVTHAMVLELHAQLRAWENDPAISHVIIKAAPGRAFSAGGDIRDLYQRGTAGKPHLQFFWDEYRLNAYIKAYPKPYIALIDGIVMGGGVGVSFHGSHRVAGDNIAFAMPEVGIGFFPDVGGSYFLPRLPGESGMYLALTGNRIKKDDCIWSGLATHSCASVDLDDLEEALCRAGDIEAVLQETANNSGQLAEQKTNIDMAFGEASVLQILQKLDHMGAQEGAIGAWAQKAVETMRTKSPTSLEIAFRQLRMGNSLSMHQCMELEYRIVSRVLCGVEFYEGIRAAIIDKDGAPQWTPASLEAVDANEIDAIFSQLTGNSGTLAGELLFE